MEDVKETSNYPGVCYYISLVLSVILMIICPFAFLFSFVVIAEYERAIIFRLGRTGKRVKGPGIFFIIPCTDSIKRVDLRTMTYDIQPQNILTRDAVSIIVDAVVFYHVYNPLLATIAVDDYAYATHFLAQTSLRNALGNRTMSEILMQRETVSKELQSNIDTATDAWGVRIERVELKDIALPTDMQRSMAAEAEATREAKAKLIAADGEKSASKSLKEAAEIMGQSTGTLQLRYLQTISNICTDKNSTIIFPLPIEMLKSFSK